MREEHYYKDFLDAFGADAQLNFAIEEMSELTKAICKYKRKINACSKEEEKKLMKDMIEEIADVKICIEELIYMFDCLDEVTKVEDFKFARGKERVKAHNLNLQVEERNE